jgi:hypothetical protein
MLHLTFKVILRPTKTREAIPVTGSGGQSGCETSRLPHFLDNRLRDGGEVFRLMRRPPFTPRKIPGTHFCEELSGPQSHGAAGRIKSIEKSNDSIGNRTHNLPVCNIVPQPTTLRRSSLKSTNKIIFESSSRRKETTMKTKM